MQEDKVKEAFTKVKQDIEDLKSQLSLISNELSDLKYIFQSQQTHHSYIPSIQHKSPTQELNERYNYPLEALKTPNSQISIGNDGVPTNRQTNQQTDRHIFNEEKTTIKPALNQSLGTTDTQNNPKIDRLEQLTTTLHSLDSIKKELRQQFKRLTNQEMLVFSTIYQLESESFVVDYSIIASKLGLSESSIRDYVIKISKKGIPIQKIKENNKKILLKIPEELRKMASLNTILALREL